MFRRATLTMLACAVALLFAGALAAQDARPHGYEHGYRDGYHRGASDRDYGVAANFRTEDYRTADRGYLAYMGDINRFRAGYQEGYEAGYSDAYYNRPGRFSEVYPPVVEAPAAPQPPPSARGYNDLAFDTGYREGVAAGLDDARHDRAWDPGKHDKYKDADHGYKGSYGSKDTYKRLYRQGFLQGYQDTYGPPARR